MVEWFDEVFIQGELLMSDGVMGYALAGALSPDQAIRVNRGYPIWLTCGSPHKGARRFNEVAKCLMRVNEVMGKSCRRREEYEGKMVWEGESGLLRCGVLAHLGSSQPQARKGLCRTASPPFKQAKRHLDISYPGVHASLTSHPVPFKSTIPLVQIIYMHHCQAARTL